MEALEWERVQSVFDAVADLAPAQQEVAVQALCANDNICRANVMALLQEHTLGPWMLDKGAGEIMSRLSESDLEAGSIDSLLRRQIGPYRLLRVLGEGGMGAVFLAERDDIGGQVAVKLLRDAWLSPMRRQRFAAEQHTLVKLNHPGIARIYDASTTDDGTPWFVMEYVEGQHLLDFLRERGGTLQDDLRTFCDVCSAVAYAHSHAVIHRDLKPSNILVTGEGRVKLLDFGIAKQIDPSGVEDRTITGLRMLTPAYAAPEQRDGGSVGTFTDVYSLGVLLCQILTGEVPERQSDDHQLTPPSKIARASRRPEVRQRLSTREWADLDVLCLTALEPVPERRYRSADRLMHDVQAFLEGRVLEARPPGLGYRAGKFMRRHRGELLGVVLAVLVIAGVSIFFTVRLARARNAALAEAARTHRIQDFMLGMLGNADGEAGPAKGLEVTTLLDREAQHASLLHDDPETQVELEQTIGSMFNKLGSYARSEEVLTGALEQAERAGSRAKLQVPALLVQRGALRADRGDAQGAQADLLQAKTLAAEEPADLRNPVLVQAQIALGRAYVQRGDEDKAVAVLAPVADGKLGNAPVVPLDERDALAALSVAQLGAQRYDLAEAASRRAIALDRRLLGNTHFQTGVDLMNLASIETTRRNPVAAEPLYREGLGIMNAWYGPDNPDVLTGMAILARTLISEGKDAEAAGILGRVLPAQERALGAGHSRVALTLVSLGDLAVRRGDLQEAEIDYSRAATINRTALGGENPATALTLSNLGAVYLKEGKLNQAEPLLRRSVDALTRLPPGNSLIGVARARWGRALLRQHRYPEAAEQLTLARQLLSAQRNPPKAEVSNTEEDLASLCRHTRCPAELASR